MVKSNKASILIVSLWIVSLLSLMALGLGFRSSLEVRLASYNRDSLRAYYLAKAGIVKAKEYLLQDDNDYDSLYQCGIELGQETFADIFNQDVGSGSFEVFRPLDEERKININLSRLGLSKEQFKDILFKLSDNLTLEVANAIVDWQDVDSTVTLPGGAENSQYSFLDSPYECKDSDFQSLEELLLVKGVTRELFQEISNYLTVYGQGKVNINTASQKVLSALIDDETGSFSALVEKIARYRSGPDGEEATVDDGYFRNIDEVKLLAQSNAELLRLNFLSGLFVFSSQNFGLTAEGRANKLVKRINCIFFRQPQNRQMNLVYYYED